MRIVSLVPSLTETLFDLGLTAKEIVGRTKFCIHPAHLVEEIPQMGGTKNPKTDRIVAAQPDLVILNKEENRREDAEILSQHLGILITDVSDFESNLGMLEMLGDKLDLKKSAAQIISEIMRAKSAFPSFPKIPAAYLIWKNPWMTVGGDTYIHSILEAAGFQNVFCHQKRYPAISLEDLAGAEIILLSSEPYPFKEKDMAEMKKIFPGKIIILVDGEMFSWFGSRAARAFPYLQKLRQEIQF